jgi:uncharacterized metal-binding protein YceD (DUF177 family)
MVTVEPWPDDGIVLELTATAAERAALQARFDLVGLEALSASVGFEKRLTEFILAGTIEATAIQTCVATLKPVKSSLEVTFERHYRSRATQDKLAGTEPTDDETEIEIFDGEDIDLGEIVAEEFYLALDPYPRSPDADQVLEDIQTQRDLSIGDRLETPFAKLRQH